jgi:wobble nucleotide-excising tRNase
MVVELTAQTIVTAGAVVTAVILLVQRFAKGVRWFDKQEKQSSDLERLKTQHDADVEKLENELAEEIRRNNAELQILTRGILACLKGLQEKGCNGPVTETAREIEEYLNTKAHCS